MKNKVLIVLLAFMFLVTAGAGISQALPPGPVPGIGVDSDENDTSAVPPGTTGNIGAGVNNQINNTTNTTNNANTNINISGSTITNSNIGSNNKVTQSTDVKNTTSITVKQEVSVLVNGRPLQSDVPSFINGDDRTMVTLRAIAEALGAKVDWDEATQTITITLGDKVVKLVIGQNSYTVNGQGHSTDTAPGISNGRTVVPARVIGEALGAKVGWNPQTSTVTVDSGSQSGQPANNSSQTAQQTTPPAGQATQTTPPSTQANQQGNQPSGQTTQPAQQTAQPSDWKAKFPICDSRLDVFSSPATSARTNYTLWDSGRFDANTTINYKEKAEINVKATVTVADASGKTLWSGEKSWSLKEKMDLDSWSLNLPPDIMPNVAKLQLVHVLQSSKMLDQGPNPNAPPLTAHDKKDVHHKQQGWNMESDATLYLTTGKLDVDTRTWCDNVIDGFHGAVQVGVWDSGGNLLWTSGVHTFGVDAKINIFASSSREDHWSETAPADILSKAVKLEIRHGYKGDIDNGKPLF